MEDHAVKVTIYHREQEYAGWVAYCNVEVQPEQTGEDMPEPISKTIRLDSYDQIGEFVGEMVQKARSYKITGLPGIYRRGLHSAHSQEL